MTRKGVPETPVAIVPCYSAFDARHYLGSSFWYLNAYSITVAKFVPELRRLLIIISTSVFIKIVRALVAVNSWSVRISGRCQAYGF
jgi:hypothetical protein